MRFYEWLKKNRLSFSEVARELGISRQWLWQASAGGGRLHKYKDKILEAYAGYEDVDKIEFREWGGLTKSERRESKKAKKVALSENERFRLSKFPYVLSPKTYKRVMEGGLMSENIKRRTIDKLEEEERYVKGLGIQV